MKRDVVIAGGGLGATRTAQTLRDLGFDGSVLIASDEERLPYDRPPLSKEYLLGRMADADIRLLDEAGWDALDVEVVLGHAARAIDPAARRIRLAGGLEVEYGTLVVATGARANRLPSDPPLAGVHYLRGVEDASALRQALLERPRVGIVGGGFIGLEVAAVARELGCEVVVCELAPGPLHPVLGAELSRLIQDWHEEHGVVFRCGAGVGQLRGNGQVQELVLTTGESVAIDVAVVGVGVRSNIEWLEGSGIELHRGIVTGAEGRSSDPHVFAVGDARCCHDGGSCRPSGHWTAAGNDANAAAAAALGRASSSPRDDGYFWSDQYDARLQFAGTSEPEPQITVSSGSIEERRFLALLGDPEKPSAVFAMSSPREFVRASRRLQR